MSKKIFFPTLKKIYLAALATVLVLTSCQVEEPVAPEPEIVIEQTEYTLSAAENRTATISFIASADWTLTITCEGDDPDWLTASDLSGVAGQQTVELTAEGNLEQAERTAYANIVCRDQKVQVTVTQSGTSTNTNFASLFDSDFAQLLQDQGIISNAQNITLQDMDNIAALTKLNVSWCQLYSLDGIKYFKSLTYLDCSKNTITELDLSQNTSLIELNTSFTNSLKELNISKCTELDILECQGNRLTALDISQNAKLTTLKCYYNELTSLDVSKCTELDTLECQGNMLTTLDVSQNVKLTELNCSYNMLTNLDTSRNTALKALFCDYNKLTDLDTGKNTSLTDLDCSYNMLTALDVSRNTVLKQCGFSCNPGDGISTFPLTVWSERSLEDLDIPVTIWTYEDKIISTSFLFVEQAAITTQNHK